MEGENNVFLRYVQVRFMKYPQNNKQKKWHEKAQGIVEYALILAFVVGIAAAIFAKGGLAEAVSDAYFQISKTIAYALDNTTAGHQRFAQSQLEKGLKQAIASGKVVLGNGGWVELDLQTALHEKVKQPVNGGADGDVKVNGQRYEYFKTLWDAANLKMNQIELDDADKGKWAGVRIERVGDSYNVYYFNGTAPNVQDDATKLGYYKNTQAMQEHFGNGQTPMTWKP